MAIHIDPKNRGKLQATLGVPAKQKIPVSKLEAAKNSPNPVTRKRANFALTAKQWNHAGAKKPAAKPYSFA